MKSLFLADVRKPELLRSALSQVLPGQEEPWLLSDAAGDPIAYFSITHEENSLEVQTDISGRHHGEDSAVAAVLEKVGAIVGGRIQDEEKG